MAAFLERRCGSLDCHGQVGRNLIVYGQDGLRLDAADVAGGAPTTAAAITATYDALIALEPEALAAVVEQGGANPQRLTLVRKARGTERHKGGAVVPTAYTDTATCGPVPGTNSLTYTATADRYLTFGPANPSCWNDLTIVFTYERQ